MPQCVYKIPVYTVYIIQKYYGRGDVCRNLPFGCVGLKNTSFFSSISIQNYNSCYFVGRYRTASGGVQAAGSNSGTVPDSSRIQLSSDPAICRRPPQVCRAREVL